MKIQKQILYSLIAGFCIGNLIHSAARELSGKQAKKASNYPPKIDTPIKSPVGKNKPPCNVPRYPDSQGTRVLTPDEMMGPATV